jgi:Domain of unknown function (DUF4190)
MSTGSFRRLVLLFSFYTYTIIPRTSASGRDIFVATDQKTAPSDGVAIATPAIENEIITYRAISAMAVTSLICGVLAVCSFATLYFLAFSLFAVLFGILALRTIKQYPDTFAGRALANAGIALGLTFGLIAFTSDFVTNYVRSSSAGRFAAHYADVMKTGSLGDVLLLDMNPDRRKGKTGADVENEMELQAAKPKERMSVEQRVGPIRTLRKRLAASGSENFHFIDIESHGIEETHGSAIQYYALALFEAEGPGSTEFPEKKQFALAVLKGQPSGRTTEWWVDDIKFPYVPKTFEMKAAPPPDDDGHGHAH